ncbi:MAG: adenylate/guanylate cyclase domain-containing protein, partial [Pseudomonadota bacterium]
IPVDRTGRAIIGWPKKLSVQSTSAARLYDQSTGSNAQLADKVVLIGLGDRLGQIVTTPIGEISALRAHAEVANRLAAGAVLVRPSWSGYLEAGLAMLLGGAAMAWSQTLGGWRSLLLTLFVAAVALAASVFAYTSQALLIDPLPGIVAALLGTFAVTGGRSLAETVGDEKLRGNFRGSLPESTVKALTEEDASSLLKGDYRTITILACEISFMASESAEALGKSPASLTKKISGACQSLRRTIVKLGGAADQSDGGKVFAYFNAPLKTADHEKAACAAALQLVEAMDVINGEFGREIPLQLSIGIATGDCLVGPMGHGRSNRYSAIGEPMEIAQTLRSLAPTYGPAIICDEAIFRSTSHNFAFLELDRCDIGDRQTPTTVFGLVGNPFVKSSKKFRALDGAHRDMLSAYRAGDAHAAKLNLLRIRRSPGADIPLFDIYEERIAELEQKAGPGPALVANKPTGSKRVDPDLAEAQTGSPTDGPSGSANEKQGNTAIGSK